jgi:hypothetical protein
MMACIFKPNIHSDIEHRRQAGAGRRGIHPWAAAGLPHITHSPGGAILYFNARICERYQGLSRACPAGETERTGRPS